MASSGLGLALVEWVRREGALNVWVEGRFVTLWGARRELKKAGFRPAAIGGDEGRYTAEWPDTGVRASARIDRPIGEGGYVVVVSYFDEEGVLLRELPRRQ